MRASLVAWYCVLDFIYDLLAYSRATASDPATRASVSVPPTLTVPGSANKDRSNEQRTSSQPQLQRSHTGGLDCAQPRTPSPTKSRLNFLEGFKNTLRTRSPVRNNSIPVSLHSEPPIRTVDSR